MKNHPEELLKGIELARIASGLDKAYYGIEKNKQDAIDLLTVQKPRAVRRGDRAGERQVPAGR